MKEKNKPWGLIKCKWPGECIHRTPEGECDCLQNADFVFECHFRKERVNGSFVWDDIQKRKNASLGGR